jgi:hypothetical protein
MSGFQVVISDLQQAASTFHTEAQAFKAIMPVGCPALPDGGGGGFDGSLESMVEALCLLHLQISGDIDNHGSKLQKAHDTYAHDEESLSQLCNQISDPDKI